LTHISEIHVRFRDGLWCDLCLKDYRVFQPKPITFNPADEGLIGSFQFNRPQRANGVATLVVDGLLHYEHGVFHVLRDFEGETSQGACDGERGLIQRFSKILDAYLRELFGSFFDPISFLTFAKTADVSTISFWNLFEPHKK
jgi:hypothetical protein